jgi:hypothetical protein
MERRRYLETVAVAGSAVAGCLGGNSENSRRRGSRRSTPTLSARTPRPTRVGDVTLPVPTTDMLSAVHRDHIPAITDPAFAADWDDLTLPEGSAAETTHCPPTPRSSASSAAARRARTPSGSSTGTRSSTTRSTARCS